MNALLLQFNEFWATVPPELQVIIVSVLKIVLVLVPLILGVAYFTYWERKILAWMHVRIGPNRVGWKGLLQPFADVIKMLLKERSEEHTSELQSLRHLVCRLLLEKKKTQITI